MLTFMFSFLKLSSVPGNPDSSSSSSPYLSRSAASLLAFLFLMLVVAGAHRLLIKRSGVIRTLPARAVPRMPVGFALSVSLVRPDPQNKYEYSVPELVKSFFPGHVLSDSRRITGGGGAVLIGQKASGSTEVQTCLMESGSAAVDLEEMLQQDRLVASESRTERIKRTVVGALTGRPRTRRPCWLVQLTEMRAPGDARSQAQRDQEILNLIWPALKSLKSQVGDRF